MKTFLAILYVGLLLILGCKNEKKEPIAETAVPPTILEKVAQAHGYDSWKDVTELQFTFNVDRDTAHFERSWIWKPQTNEITGMSLGDTTNYYRKQVDSTLTKVDGAFINDKYWLLAPYNLVWDKDNFSFKHVEDAKSPLSEKPMQLLTITYDSEGGYTPGDAYDFYLDSDYMIKEWVFRKSNQKEPSMTTTWEDYNKIDGMNIAQMHSNKEGDFKLYFTNIQVKTK